MKIALTEKEIQLLEIIRGIADGSVCVHVADGSPESVIVKREIFLEQQSE